MPRDKRLWMSFPIDFPEHPKVKPLSTAAKWAFVEMNGYSRRHDLDGRIPAKTALTMWSKRILTELVNSHPDRPLVLLADDVYVLRDYAEHQDTTEAREQRSITGHVNGVKGGRPRKVNPTETQLVSATEPDVKQGQRSGSETEDKTDHGHPSEVRHVIPARVDLTDEEFLAESAKALGIKRMDRVTESLEAVVGRLAPAIAVDVARAVLDLSTEHVRYPAAYIAKAAAETPETVRAEWARIVTTMPKEASLP